MVDHLRARERSEGRGGAKQIVVSVLPVHDALHQPCWGLDVRWRVRRREWIFLIQRDPAGARRRRGCNGHATDGSGSFLFK
jgi:hypothetical protein